MHFRKLHMLLLLFTGLLFSRQLTAQYNNEWIDYNKAYYKFKVGQTGLYRIPYDVLQAAGLGSGRAEHFQLWRNGQEVPLYTSVATGLFSQTDFIEFFGVMNDGKPDAVMYKKPEFQLSDKWSLQTDTAAYFLTLNTNGSNTRLAHDLNNVAGNTLTPDRYFMYTFSRNFKDQINAGYAAIVGVYVYSSSYDNGEGWSSRNIQPASPLVEQYNNLFPASDGPDPVISITGFGNAYNSRKLQVRVNGVDVLSEQMDYFSSLIKEQSFAKSLLKGVQDTIRIINSSAINTDRVTLGKYEIIYPRQFNFGGASLFEFTLPENLMGNFLEIANFNANGAQPILYNLTNRKRYLGDISLPGKVRFALPAGGARDFVLMNASSTSVLRVNAFEQKKFTNFGDAANQGDYLMIVHNSLRASANGDAIENYKNYRSSPEGGAYRVGIYDIDELVDQFAFGIKKHPLSIKNFIAFARALFSKSPSNILLVGKGITYDQYRSFESRSVTERMNLVPTFGNPGSDNILASSDNDPTPEVPIGRLSVVRGDEINAYLEKVKEHAKALLPLDQSIAGKAWMKNFAHVIGGGDPYLQSVILGYMNGAKRYVEDTSYGARVYTFEKVTSAGVDLVNSGLLGSLFSEGLGVITYFGHSSANSMEFNLDNPNVFDNPGRYPLFIANGCNAGNFFIYDTLRISNGKRSISENYVLTPNRGSIGFLASTHYGIVNYLNIYTTSLYKRMAGMDYASTLGRLQANVITEIIQQIGMHDYYNLITAEQILLNGDPAVQLYPHLKPDYAIEEPQIRISPLPLSITHANFDLKIKYYNIGKATKDSIDLLVKRVLPDGKWVELFRQRRPPVYVADSVNIAVPINPYTDKGQNKIQVYLDSVGLLSEITRSNNFVTKNFIIADDEVRPVFPNEFSIVNSPSPRLTATTGNFLQKPAQYILEVDTTALFDSPLKVTQLQSSLGGVIDFNPVLPLRDSLVFYWRVAKKPDTGTVYNWSGSSFVYLSQSGAGWNQSHYFQYLKNTYDKLVYNGRDLEFGKQNGLLAIKTGIFPNLNTQISQNLNLIRTTGCSAAFGSLEFMVFDKKTGLGLKNISQGATGLFNSISPCFPAVQNQFNFYYGTATGRRYIMDFLNAIPSNTMVIATNWANTSLQTVFVDEWKKDTLLYGPNHSLYHQLKQYGFKVIDSFNKNLPMILVFEKDQKGNIQAKDEKIGSNILDIIDLNFDYLSYGTEGAVSTTIVGPAKKWNSLHWKEMSSELGIADTTRIAVIGLKTDFSEVDLYASQAIQKDTILSFIDAREYPYIKLVQSKKDFVYRTPSISRYLQIKYDPVPEGALTLSNAIPLKDTLEVGEPLLINLAFKNISNTSFDSLRTFIAATDPQNNSKVLFDGMKKPLVSKDTIQLNYSIDTKNLVGDNSIYVNFNPGYAQPEQYLFNNFLNKNIYVRPDNYAPNLDVTFDGLHILNKDMVSPKPTILIKLKDDSRFLALNDTSLFSVRIRYPSGTIRVVRFDNDTLQFTPSLNPLGGNNNTASLLYKPYLTEDGEYELMVTAKDRSNNLSGALDYSVVFQVVNKSMITNLLNYPNPFTTSTSFVFTLTGAAVPSYLSIQILTVTGKIVKEINKHELGPLRIGHNITEYKWDGRDQFGQPLANGVYLYRVMSEIDGKKIEKLKTGNFNTEKYFQGGYGKMYLMR